MRHLILMGAVLLLLAACGRQELPVAQEPTIALQTESAATATAVGVENGVTSVPSPEQSATSTTNRPTTEPTVGALLPSEAALTVGSPQSDEQLLRDLLNTSSANPAVRFFYYIENPSPESEVAEARFWRVDLQTGAQTLITTRPASFHFNTVVQSQLSPDGQWLAYAYQPDPNENAGDLYVMRVDGSEERLVAEGIGVVGKGCQAYFAWSPDSTLIAVNRFDRASADPGWRLELVDITQPDAAMQLVAAPFLKFGGWVSEERLLLISGYIEDRIPRVEEINITTQQRSTVYAFEKDTAMYCIKPSPNVTTALINAGNGNWLLDIATGQVQSSPVDNSTLATWFLDGSALLMLPPSGPERSFISSTDTSTTREFVRLAPDTPPGTAWSSIDASPDSQYLVACQFINQEGHSGGAYLLLYTVASNAWSVLQAGCGPVAGWN